MRLKLSAFAITDLHGIQVRERAILRKAIETLKVDPYPDGPYGNIEVSSIPVRVFAQDVPLVHRLKSEKPKTGYRVLYIVDEDHDTVLVVMVRPRDAAYPKTEIGKSMVRRIVKNYFDHKGWENDFH